MDAAERTRRVRRLAERLLQEVPETFWETGMLPTLQVPSNQDVELDTLSEIEWSDTWPYQQTTLGGRRIGIRSSTSDQADVLAVHWLAATESGLEERKLYLPATPMGRSQYEVYIQLRRDGTEPGRAAELADRLG